VSTHGHDNHLPIPEIRLGPKAASVERTAAVIGALGALLCVAGFFYNRAEFFQSYLFAFLYWGGFTIGGLGILVLANTVGGRWGATARRYLEAAMRTLPFLAVLFLILLIGLKDIYPWTHIDTVRNPISQAILRHKTPYLNVPFFIARAIIYFAVWIFWGYRIYKLGVEQDRTGDPGIKERLRKFCAPGCVIVTFTATFAYIDWLLSADAQFFSTIYGAMLLFGDVLQTFALVITVLILTSQGDRFGGRINSVILHDLGNLMFAFTIFWTYLSVSQLIIVWPANLPQELHWYLVRARGGWTVLAAMTACVMFLIPFLGLLSQTNKRNPQRLIRLAVWILCARMIDLFWVIMPTFRTNGFAIYWTDFAAFFGIGGIWVYLYLGQLRRQPLLPLNDARVMNPLPEAVA
jgi:hypothetical protein